MKKLTLVTLKVDGSLSEKQIDPVDCLPDLQEAVGGHLEVVPGFVRWKQHRCVAFCNEEGKLEGLPYNHKANDLWSRNLEAQGVRYNSDVLVGDVAIVFGDAKLMAML